MPKLSRWPFTVRMTRGVVITAFDKDGVERVGLVKLDLLGNRSLSTVSETVRWIQERTGERIVELLFRLNREHGTTLVLVTHDLDLASRCDRILFMEAGRIEREEETRAS